VLVADVFLYLTTTGRRSGVPRRIEIWFVEHDGDHFVVAENRDRAQWVRNLLVDARVTFSVGTRDAPDSVVSVTAARARPLDGPGDAARAQAVSALMDDKYGWSDGLIVKITPG
jgi:deazaflavin-dependent oxidoreductase (nitroreductase family)